MLLAPQTVGLLVQCKIAGFGRGTWCSGITPAQHAGGPGFNAQCVQTEEARLWGASEAVSRGSGAPPSQ